MKSIKKLRLFLSLFISAALLITGCSAGGNSTGGKAETKELTFWVYGWETEGVKAIEEDARAWEKSNPGVKIKVVPQTNDAMTQKIPAVVAGGDNPDISFLNAGSDSINLIVNDKLLALDDYGANEIKEQFYPGVWDSMVWQDKVYGLRITSNNLALYYNKELFEKANVPLPDEDWTWDELLEAAKKLTNAQENVYGLELPVFSKLGEWKTWIWMTFLWQNGGEFLNQDRTKAVFNSPEGVEAAEFWNALVNEHKVAPKDPAGQGIDRFLTGKAAMAIQGPWMIRPWYGDPAMKDKIGVAPLPKKEIAATNIGGEAIVIFKNTKYPQEAYEYVKHLTTNEEFLNKFYKAWITNTPLKSFSGFYNDDPLLGEPMQVFDEQMEAGKSRQFVPAWVQINDNLDRELSEMIYNGKSAKDALDDAAQEADKLLSESR